MTIGAVGPFPKSKNSRAKTLRQVAAADFSALVRAIRDAERALGSPTKDITTSEARNIAVARKSLVALQTIAAGELFTPENLGAKRPGNGVSPIEYWEWLGRPSPRTFAANELILP